MSLMKMHPHGMPNISKARWEFNRLAQRAERMGLGKWIDAYQPRGDVSIMEMYRAVDRFRAALDRQEVKQ